MKGLSLLGIEEFTDVLCAIAGACRSLHVGQGRIARRNARKRVRQQLRQMQARVDELYPGQRKPTKRTPKPTTLRGRKIAIGNAARRLHEQGWWIVPTGVQTLDGRSVLDFYAEAATAGIRARKLVGVTWMPAWAWHGWRKQLPLAHLKKDLGARRALLATIALENSR